MSDKPKEWITVNGAHVPLDEEGGLAGEVGEKIEESNRKQAEAESAAFASYKRQYEGDLRTAAKQFYDGEYLGTSVTPQNGPIAGKDIHFKGGDDRKKFFHNINVDPVKAEAMQYVKDVIRTGKFIGESKADPRRGGGRFGRFYHYQKEIPMLDEYGKPRKLVVDVGKTHAGKLEYIAHNFIHNHAVQYREKAEALRKQGVLIEDGKIKKAGFRLSSEVFFPPRTNPPGSIKPGHRKPAFDETVRLAEAEVNRIIAEGAREAWREWRRERLREREAAAMDALDPATIRALEMRRFQDGLPASGPFAGLRNIAVSR